MTDGEFQTEIFVRLKSLEQETTKIKTLLHERCPLRQATLDKCVQDINALWGREHKREGGKAALIGLLGAASAAGAALVKMLPFGGQ